MLTTRKCYQYFNDVYGVIGKNIQKRNLIFYWLP